MHSTIVCANSKVFCIGMYKTGTTSVATALQALGYKTSKQFLKQFNPKSPEDYWNVDSAEGFAGHFEDIKNYATNYEAFKDAPWMYLYRELDLWFPGSKFIITTRSPAEVAASDINMTLRSGRIAAGEQDYIDRYNRHLANVKQYFKNRPDDLLVFDVTEGWGPLVKFLDKKAPNQSFPHVNRGFQGYSDFIH